MRLRCGPGDQGPAGSSLLPTLLWVPGPTCKHQASFSGDSLLACHGESCFSYHCYREPQPTGFIPLHTTSLASSWRDSRPPISRNPSFWEPSAGLGWQRHRVIQLWIPAGRGDSPPFGFRHACRTGSAAGALGSAVAGNMSGAG